MVKLMEDNDDHRIRYQPVCEICKKGPEDDVAVYRTGEKGPGKDPHWRCSVDMPKETEVSADVLTTVAAIESQSQTKH